MADSKNSVLFARGKKESYLNLEEKDPDTFYFISDTRELYQGDKLYTESIRFYFGNLPEIYAIGIIYFNEETGVGSVHNGEVWRDIIVPTNVSIIGDYNNLTNVPIKNIEGNPVILNLLETGIYNIIGKWTVIDGADIFDSSLDGLFFIYKNDDEIRIMKISSDGISKIILNESTNPNDIVYDSIPMVSDAAEEVKKDLWGEL